MIGQTESHEPSGECHCHEQAKLRDRLATLENRIGKTEAQKRVSSISSVAAAIAAVAGSLSAIVAMVTMASERTQTEAVLDSVDFEFEISSGNLEICPVSNFFYNLKKIHITPKFVSDSGETDMGEGKSYSLDSIEKTNVFNVPCYWIEKIGKQVCHQEKDCGGRTIRGLIVEYNLPGNRFGKKQINEIIEPTR